MYALESNCTAGAHWQPKSWEVYYYMVYKHHQLLSHPLFIYREFPNKKCINEVVVVQNFNVSRQMANKGLKENLEIWFPTAASSRESGSSAPATPASAICAAGSSTESGNGDQTSMTYVFSCSKMSCEGWFQQLNLIICLGVVPLLKGDIY